MPRKTPWSATIYDAATGASMRPRPDAAENPGAPWNWCAASFRRFNEAAARCRGKPLDPFRGDDRESRLQ